MIFLEPLLLLAMPLIGLPIVIHLLNQRRHKTAPWAARRFILQASSLGRGMASFRQWLVLALRTLAVAAVIFAMSRPLTSRIPGFGLLGSNRAQIVVMDRSPSMAIRDGVSRLPWRETCLNKLQQHLSVLGGKVVLFHPLDDEPVPVMGANLLRMLETRVTDSQTNLPRLIERALTHIKAQAVGPSDIWVCTDLRASDWQLESGRWNRIRENLKELSEVKLRFITPEESNQLNLAVSVSKVELVRESDRQFVYLDFSIRQNSGAIQQRKVPVQVLVNGAERTIDIEMGSPIFNYRKLQIEVPAGAKRGGGVVRLPHDGNERDNHYYFTYSSEPIGTSVIVSDHEEVSGVLELVCSTPFQEQRLLECTTLPVSAQNEIDWQRTALLIWHAPLPSGMVAQHMRQFVLRGGRVVFLPTENLGAQESLFDVKWGEWQSAETESGDADGGYRVAQWRTEDDLLATDESGIKLPLQSLRCRRRRGISSTSAATLATFEDGAPLLTRAATPAGGVYFMATTPDEATSSFTSDGIALYVMLQRAIEQGASSLSQSRQLDTRSASLVTNALANPERDIHRWKSLGFGDRRVPEDQRAYFSGLYEADEYVVAVNRPATEDDSERIEQSMVEQLLGDDSFELVSTSTTSVEGLTSEIWKVFIVGMVLALIAEGWFSLPPRKKRVEQSGGGGV